MGIGKLVNNYIDKALKARAIPDSPYLPIGYNPLEVIRQGLYHWVAVPFNGVDVWCQLRCLNGTQLEACGDVTAIVIANENDKLTSRESIIKVRNFQEKVCRAVFNIPKFDSITELVGDYDFVISDKQKELDAIRKQIEDNADKLTSVEKELLETQADTLDLFLGYILPRDTMDFVTFWAMGNDVSDIKKVTKEKYLEAAALAKYNKGAPTDYISGVFTDHNKPDMNKYAWIVYNEYQEHNKIDKTAKKGKYKYIGGPKQARG